MLVLVDTSIYIFRAWLKHPATLLNRFDQPDNAVQGLAHTLCEVIEAVQPDYMVCAFDECFRKGIRNQLYPPYKADRPPAPEELSQQFNRCKAVAQAMGIPTFGSDRVEADDIIGQFARLAQANHLPVMIVSGDKDLMQYVTEPDHYWDTGKRAVENYSDVVKRLKIRPDQIADWLALSGDKSDNIPGVPGVGASTAARLLIKWQTLDNLLNNLGEVAMMRFRGATRVSRMLYENKDTIHLARSLTGLIEDERLPDQIDALKRRLPVQTRIQSDLYEIGLSDELSQALAQRVSAVVKPQTDKPCGEKMGGENSSPDHSP